MPLRSMTGFGTAEGTVSGGRLRVETRTVNHRHLNLQLKLPGELGSLESGIRERLRSHFERGHVVVSARWLEVPPETAAVTVDEDRARAVVEALRGLAGRLGLQGDVDLATVARLPDVIRVTQAESEVDLSSTLEVVERSAEACAAERRREGVVLEAELRHRLAGLRSLAARVEERSPGRVVEARDRLSEAVKELAGGVAVDAGRLAQEIAILAERLDVTEELVRLRAHAEAVEAAIGDGGHGAGRRLGFLLQELGRETNTIGSKANDAVIAAVVVEMKGELEKMREQVENIE